MLSKPVAVKGKKLLTSKQIAMNTVKSAPLVGQKIASASSNSGNNTVESHCANPLILPSNNTEVIINDLKSQITMLQNENRLLLGLIGKLSGQTTDKPLPMPVTEKVTIIPEKTTDKEYCDSTYRARFVAICQKVDNDRLINNTSRYGKSGKTYPSQMAFFLAQKISANKEKLELMPVKTLENLERDYIEGEKYLQSKKISK
jgi:hypothetical protein